MLSQKTITNKYSLPGKLRDEIRRTAALKSYSYVFSQTQMKVKNQESLMHDMYHGGNKCVSQIDQIVGAEPPFADLYDHKVKVVTDSLSDGASVDVYTLKQMFSRTDIPYRAGQEITRSVLELVSFKGADLVTGRALLHAAKFSLRTIRKAVAICKEYVHESGEPKHSGTTRDDVIEKVLDRMYETLKGKTRMEDVKPDEKDLVLPPRSADWFFYGWMAFLLYGPMEPPERRMSLLEEGENFFDNDKSSSRLTARKHELEEKKAYKDHKSDKHVKCLVEKDKENVLPVMTFNQLQAAENLELKKEALLSDRKTTLLSAFGHKQQLLEYQIQLAKERAKRYCPTFDCTNIYWQKLEKLEDELPVLLFEIQEIMSEPRHRYAKKIKTGMVTDTLTEGTADTSASDGIGSSYVNLGGIPGIVTTSNDLNVDDPDIDESDSILECDVITGLCRLQQNI